MIIYQNILAILGTFSNLQKYFMKNFTPMREFPELLLLNFLAKFVTEKKSNKLALALLYVYGSWKKLGTMHVTSRTGIISAIYKKDD